MLRGGKMGSATLEPATTYFHDFSRTAEFPFT
jgi:hypothetical protein